MIEDVKNGLQNRWAVNIRARHQERWNIEKASNWEQVQFRSRRRTISILASLWVSNICYNFLSAILVMVTAFTETPFPRIWYDVTDGDFGVSHTVRLCPRLTNQGYLDYRSWVLCLYGCYSCMMEVRIYNLECLGSFVRAMVPLA